jgi:hypothetical protein
MAGKGWWRGFHTLNIFYGVQIFFKRIMIAGKKPLLTSALRYMGTSPGGSASPVT